jgi:type III restriction enzyme
MTQYIKNRNSKKLDDILLSGFEKQDTVFINWETVTKKGNTALKQAERKNLIEQIEQAKRDNIKFIIIIDEEHRNKTEKAEAIIQEFEADHIIRVSATTKRNDEAKHIRIDELEVIESGLITRALYINESIQNSIEIDNETEFLLQLAIDKQKEIRQECIKNKIRYNPLVIIQVPSQSDELIKKIEKYLSKNGYTYDNNTVAIWLADRKERIEDIEKNMSEQCFLIMKQAISTGWDCPRAKILVKLRENMHEDFEIQTLGRIRRMPEAKHYENELLDNCYLYTFDEEYTESVKQELGKNASDVKIAFLKNQYKDFSLIKELKDNEVDNFAPREAFYAMYDYFMKKYNLSTKCKDNVLRLENAGYNFSVKIENEVLQGKVIEVNKENINSNDKIIIESKVDTHRNGLDLKHSIGVISSKVGMLYQHLSPVLQRLFLDNIVFNKKILKLKKKEFYAFIINNEDMLKQDILEAVAQKREQQVKLKMNYKKEVTYKFPEKIIVKYNKNAKESKEMKKNIYAGYPSSSIKGSQVEDMFENWCENSDKVKYWCKNGESSQEFFSIIYLDNVNKAWTFYPDYILQDNVGNVWIIETKGGEDLQGNSKNIDIKVENKYQVLRDYAEKHDLKWGFVRDIGQNLYLSSSSEYIEDMKNKAWKNINEIF